MLLIWYQHSFSSSKAILHVFIRYVNVSWTDPGIAQVPHALP